MLLDSRTACHKQLQLSDKALSISPPGKDIEGRTFRYLLMRVSDSAVIYERTSRGVFLHSRIPIASSPLQVRLRSKVHNVNQSDGALRYSIELAILG